MDGFKEALSNLTFISNTMRSSINIVSTYILTTPPANLMNSIPNIFPEALKDLAAGIKDNTGTPRPEDIQNLFETALKLCADNPIMAVICVLQVLLLAFPAAIIAPFLAILGFSGLGPVAGESVCFFTTFPLPLFSLPPLSELV